MESKSGMSLSLRARRPVALIALLPPLLAGCGKPPYENVDNAGLQGLISQGVPVYDIRRPEEWRKTGVVAGSHKLTYMDERGRVNPSFLAEFGARVGKHDPVVLICRTGNRTDSLARALMEKHGYTRVYNVRDGITAWIGAGRPLVGN